MRVRRSTCAVIATAAFIGACGRIGYDVDGRSGLDSGSGGSSVTGTLAGNTLGSPVSTTAAPTTVATGTAGGGGDGAHPSMGGAGGDGATTVSGSVATGGSGGNGGVGVGGAGTAGDDGGVSGGAGGQSGAGGASGICFDGAPVRLLYRHYSDLNGQINVGFKVVNNTGAPLALRDMKARYFFTNELGAPTATIVYGDICCPDTNILGHVRVAVVPMIPRAPTADTYAEVTFDLGAGFLDTGHAVEVEVEVRGSTAGIPTQTNDYSYIASATASQQQWDACPGSANCAAFQSCAMTVMVSNTLVWGTPP